MSNADSEVSKIIPKSLSGTRIVATTLGTLVGLAGIEHGFFEVLQGNTVPNDTLIDAIGPNQKFWEGAKETAFTIIPNFFITGILAIILGIIVTIWSLRYIDKKYGASGYFILNFLLFLVGGGWGPPITFGILASVVATRINKPHTWWKSNLSNNLRKNLVKLWPWLLISYVIIFVISVALQIFGWPLVGIFGDAMTESIIWILAIIQLVLMVIAVITGIAYDIENIEKTYG
ncbi:MAG: hypothetical protein ACW981_18360 [Candidatus Hodarchaeales archaeon]|jgi:hypothetical protein